MYLDLGLGISGDMFSAACYSYMDDDMRRAYLGRMSEASEGHGGRIIVREMSLHGLSGHMISLIFEDATSSRSGTEAARIVGDLVRRLRLSEQGEDFTKDIFQGIIEAEASAHGVSAEKVHLHEIGRLSGLFNMASAGLCHDLLSLNECEVIGSPISMGKGRIETGHGWLDVPAPASAQLASKLATRIGPYEGEMATPTGIAIVRSLISGQVESLPRSGREGVGFGSKSFNGSPGYLRLFESAERNGGR